jgi:hypothetical protein
MEEFERLWEMVYTGIFFFIFSVLAYMASNSLIRGVSCAI